MSEPNAGQLKARAWYDTLEPLPADEAEAMLHASDPVSIMFGTVRDTMPRAKAVELLRTTARVPPDDQPGVYRYHRLVTIDDGWPIQLRTL